MEDRTTAPTRRRKAAKPAERQAVSKVKATLLLSPEASQRLSVHAAMLGLDRSALVDQLIRDNLRRFVVSDRAKSADEVVGAMVEGSAT